MRRLNVLCNKLAADLLECSSNLLRRQRRRRFCEQFDDHDDDELASADCSFPTSILTRCK